MKKIPFIFIFSVTILYVFYTGYYKNNNDDRPKLNVESVVTGGPILVESSNTNKIGTIDQTHSLNLEKNAAPVAFTYFSLKSYSNLTNILDIYWASGKKDEAEKLIELVDTKCSQIFSEHYSPYHGRDSEGAKLLDSFCYGYDKGFNVHAAPPSIVREIQNRQEALLEELANELEVGSVENLLLEAIHEASDPFELEAVSNGASLFIDLSRGYNFQFNANQNITLDDISIANAISIFSCNKFNHCNKGGIEYIDICLVVGDICKNYTNTVDILYAHLSPVKVEKVEYMLSAIYNYAD